ncbi:MAG: hypothetical protein ABSD56_15845, partial [Bryobacteraceae bacterium]
MIWAALVFGLPVAAGWCGVRAVLPLRRMAPGWAGLLVEGALGAGLGMGIASVVYFLLLLAGSASRATVFASEAVLLAAAVALLFLRRETEARQIVPARPALRWNWILALALAAGLALVASGLVEVAAAAPYGPAKFFTGIGPMNDVAKNDGTKNNVATSQRLTSYAAKAWQSDVIVDLISATTTDTGLTVRCELDTNSYAMVQLSPAAMETGLPNSSVVNPSSLLMTALIVRPATRTAGFALATSNTRNPARSGWFTIAS